MSAVSGKMFLAGVLVFFSDGKKCLGDVSKKLHNRLQSYEQLFAAAGSDWLIVPATGGNSPQQAEPRNTSSLRDMI